MSDIEKAIEVLKQQVKIYSCSQGDCPCEHTDTCQHIHLESMEPATKGFTVYEANQTAIAALEKLIPKNPIKKEEQYKKITVEIYYCPICNEEVSRRSRSSYLCETPYCDECGQKLDWSEASNG